MAELTTEQRQERWANFYVQIVESPHADDLFEGRTEGQMLREALKLAGVPCRYRPATTLETFRRALSTDLGDAVEEGLGLPLLHISAHGNPDGLALTDGSFLVWEDLRALLLPINESTLGQLGLYMSSCHGYHACQMALGADSSAPFQWVIGPEAEARWGDAAISFATFYNRLFQGDVPTKAFDAMAGASIAPGGFLMFGHGALRRRVEPEGSNPQS